MTSPTGKHHCRKPCRRNHRRDPRHSIGRPADGRRAACSRWRECIDRCYRSRPRHKCRNRRYHHNRRQRCHSISPRQSHTRSACNPIRPCKDGYYKPSLTGRDCCTSRSRHSHRPNHRRNIGRPADCMSARCRHHLARTGDRCRFRPRCTCRSRGCHRNYRRWSHSICPTQCRRKPGCTPFRQRKDDSDMSSPPDRLRCK